MRAAIYARYSSNLQSYDSIEAQVYACQKYCDQNGYQVVAVYEDEAASAKTTNRPKFLEMLEDAKQNKFDKLIIHKIDRFSRNLHDAVTCKFDLQKAGVTIEFVDQKIDGSPESVILESVLMGLSEYYSKNLAKETMKVLMNNARKGKFNGGYPPFGYKIVEGNYAIEPIEAEGVKLIFEMFIAGRGYKEILAELNARNFKSRFGRPFSKNSLHDILVNPRYAGTYVFNRVKRRPDGSRNSHSSSDELICLPDQIPAIIDKQTFDAVEKSMKKRKGRGGAAIAKRSYFLSGFIRCGECGAAMLGKSSMSNSKEYLRYYCGCQDRRQKECDNATIPLSEMEQFVLAQINEVLFSKRTLSLLSKEIGNAYKSRATVFLKDLEAMQKQKDDLQKKTENILRFIENGNTSTALCERLNANEAAIKNLDAKISEIRLRQSQAVLSEKQIVKIVAAYKQKITKKNPDDVRALLNTFLDSVVVHKDRVEVNLKISVGLTGAEGRTRTGTPSLTADFESVSTIF